MELMNIYARHTYSYIHLRKAVGWIGISLPFILAAGSYFIFEKQGIEQTISHYYHTGMRDFFVGGLCAIALFMLYYSGYNKWDNIIGNIAGVAAIGVAFFGTTEHGPADWIGKVHYICAGILFSMLAIFSLWLFRKGEKGVEPTPQKKQRNLVYLICGIIIIVCMISIPVYHNFIADYSKPTIFVFVAETIALLAFGFSWLIKGGVMLNDK